MSPPSDWQRFAYWLQQGEHLPAMVQALCALITAGLTAALVWVTHKYVRITQELAASARRQLEVAIQPILEIQTDVQRVSTTAPDTWYAVRTSIKNKGLYPVSITRALISWQSEGSGEPEERRLVEFRQRVMAPGEQVEEQQRLCDRGGFPLSIDHLDSFADFITVDVSCRDLTGLCCREYSYQRATGLSCSNEAQIMSASH